MTPDQKRLVKSSFVRLSARIPDVIRTFYDDLFREHPELMPLFANTDMARQRSKLIEALKLLVDSLDELEKIKPEIQALGGRHIGYGALPSHYPIIGATLVNALKKAAGPSISADALYAWKVTLDAVSAIMMSGRPALTGRQI